MPATKVVEVIEFETTDPELMGAMRITTTLRDLGDGTEVSMVQTGIPVGVAREDNQVGTEMALAALVALVENNL